MSDDDAIIEILAALEHEQWTYWSKAIDREWTRIPVRLKKRWKELWMPYEQLPEHMKEQDRLWARKVLAALAHRDSQPDNLSRLMDECDLLAGATNDNRCEITPVVDGTFVASVNIITTNKRKRFELVHRSGKTRLEAVKNLLQKLREVKK